jgi:AcrR family transcriptional regulator
MQRGAKMPRKSLQTAQIELPELPKGDPRSLRSQDAMRRAFLQLLEGQTLERITIQDITAAAGVSYVTFFRHYSTKEELLGEIAAEQIRRLVDLTLPILDAEDSRASSLALCSYVNDHRPLWSRLLTGGAAGVLRQEYIRVSAEISATRAQPGSWLPADIAGILFVSSTLELLAWWLRQDRPMSVDRIAGMLDKVIATPILQANHDESPGAARRKR